MFTSENWKVSNENVLEISKSSAPVVKGMLQFMYTGQTEIILGHAQEWLQIADMYEISRLILLAEKKLSRNITVENAAEFYHYALLYNSKRLKYKSLKFITK